MTLSLGLAPAPLWEWRLLTGGIVLALAWPATRAILFQRGPAAVVRFEWAADGTWSVLDRRAGWIHASLAPQTAAVGPWVLLVWVVGSGQSGFRRRDHRYALIDAAGVSRTAFRALRARLTLSGGNAGSGGAQ